MVTVTRHEPGKPPQVIAGDAPKKRPEPSKAALPPGERSKALAAEIERLQAAHADQAAEVKRLAGEVGERQGKLDGLRASGIIGKVDAGVVTAFEKELKGLGKRLAEARSTLTGLEAMLDQARAELAEAQKRDAEEALTTKELEAAQKALEKNAKALAKTHKAFLGALEVGAGALMAEAGPPWEEWQGLVKERRKLYGQLCNLTGGDPDRQVLADPLATLYPDDVGEPILDLVEMLLDLVEVYGHWNRVRGRKRERLW